MAVFLRGDVWWFEWRTRKERVVRTTGFRADDSEGRKKAQAVLDAFRLAKSQKPKRSVMEGILEAIYGDRKEDADDGLALGSLWAVYEDWMTGKGKIISHKELIERRGMVARFVKWAGAIGIVRFEQVEVATARSFIRGLMDNGKSNKTQRRIASVLSSVWEAVGQLRRGVHNPWKAARPDKDGSEVERGAFSAEEEKRVLKAAEEVGHGWWLASMISRWTGLRYGDVARLDWSEVDLAKRIISVRPSKTRKHGVFVMVPISGPLYDALSGVAQDKREGFVFPEHALIYPSCIPPQWAFARVLEAAGLDTARFTFHSWRHTFRTRLAEAGVSDEVARRLGGWTNLKMAAHYDHATHLGEMRDAVARMSGY